MPNWWILKLLISLFNRVFTSNTTIIVCKKRSTCFLWAMFAIHGLVRMAFVGPLHSNGSWGAAAANIKRWRQYKERKCLLQTAFHKRQKSCDMFYLNWRQIWSWILYLSAVCFWALSLNGNELLWFNSKESKCYAIILRANINASFTYIPDIFHLHPTSNAGLTILCQFWIECEKCQFFPVCLETMFRN